ncbi:MAG: pyroglutamyl-peptidase I [Burkholderiaceae bacterium]
MSASPAPNRAPGGPESTGAPRPRVVLLTGFDAFGGDALNPSASLVEALDGQALDGQALDGWRVAGGLLPTVFGRSLDELHRLLDRHRPALVLCTGLAGGRPALSLERVAININDARIPDNAAAQPIDTPVVAGAPAAYFSTLPIKAMRAAIEAAGVPAEISQTAGTFVCNHVFYGLMHALHSRSDLHGVRGGFMHVPWLPGQGTPSLALQPLVQGTRAALACAIAHITQGRDDDRSAGGALH